MRNKKAEMGIGTLIIFIALLLVAAIAAGVLIQTAGSLQEKALTTGDQAKGQIATNVRVIEVSATDGQTGTLREFQQLMKLSPGSDSIKLDQVLLTVNTFNTTTSLLYQTASPVVHERNETNGYFTDVALGRGNFTVEYLQRGPNFIEGNIQRGDVIRVYFEMPRNVSEDEHIRINFVPRIGTPTLTEFITPNVISTERVYLYP